ncbi:MAG: hypothetical protein NWF10_00370 [Candidatus Bathyarchaeota archaeon]|nr:hypothetical protein [Candidatus Bathyarchaeota archaeon]
MLSVTFGVIIGIVQFRNLVKTRRIKLYTELFNKLTEKEMQRNFMEVLMIWKWKDIDEFFEKYGPEKNPDEFWKFASAISHLENVGLFVKEKLVDKEWVANLVDYMVIEFWEKYEPIITKMGEPFNNPCITPMAKYLYEQIKSMRPAVS